MTLFPTHRRSAFAVVTVGIIALTVTACSSTPAKTASSASTAPKGPEVTLVAATTIQDRGYNQLAFDGINGVIGKVGGKLRTVESTTPNANQSDIEAASRTSSLVFVTDLSMADPLVRVATNNPKVNYCILDYDFGGKAPSNVQYDVFASSEGSYLAGIVAAGVSKTGSIGFVGGIEIPVLKEFLAGYEAGAKSVNPAIKVSVVWTGSFTDQAKGKEAAVAEIARKADVIYQVAGGTGTGVIAAAQAAGVYAIGVNVDQNYLAPETVITSVVKRVDVAARQNIVDLAAGNWKGGKQLFNLANNGVGLAPFHSLDSKVPDAIKKLVAKAQSDIISGAITVPTVPAA